MIGTGAAPTIRVTRSAGRSLLTPGLEQNRLISLVIGPGFFGPSSVRTREEPSPLEPMTGAASLKQSAKILDTTRSPDPSRQFGDTAGTVAIGLGEFIA